MSELVAKGFDELIALNEMEAILAKAKKYCEQKIGMQKFAGMETEDVVQEVLIKIYKAVETFDPSKAKASTYFYYVIDNGIKDHLRISGSRRNLAVVNALTIIDDVANEVDKSGFTDNEIVLGSVDCTFSTKEYIYDILENIGLNEREIRIFKMRAAGYQFDEIAGFEGCSKARMSQLWSKVQKKISQIGK